MIRRDTSGCYGASWLLRREEILTPTRHHNVPRRQRARFVEKDGRVELREYPALRVAETQQGGDDFMRLFRYISKGNATEQKIAMTTPVFMVGEGTTNSQIAFVLPETLTNPPAPANDQVVVREMPPATYAVLRFKGGQQGPEGKAAQELRAWMEERKLTAKGDPQFAYFDPRGSPASSAATKS